MFSKRVPIIILWGIVFLAIALVGCSSRVDSSELLPAGGKQGQETAKEQEQGNTPGPGEPVLLASEKTKVVLFFGNSDGYLVPVIREIPKVPGIARATAAELIKGPDSGSNLQHTIPPGTTLRDINIQETGLAVVDFSSEFKTKHCGGSMGESLTVYSVVNTLTQFPSIKEVQILVDGQKLETLVGHLSLDRPIERNSSIIRSMHN